MPVQGYSALLAWPERQTICDAPMASAEQMRLIIMSSLCADCPVCLIITSTFRIAIDARDGRFAQPCRIAQTLVPPPNDKLTQAPGTPPP